MCVCVVGGSGGSVIEGGEEEFVNILLDIIN